MGRRQFFPLLLLTMLTALAVSADQSAPAFAFRDVSYFHRWSQGTQHEFTPAKQEDLDHWSDMITINAYPEVGDGEELSDAANTVLGNYENNGGKILNTRSVPRTGDREAEHLISVLFTQPDLTEAAFARFKLVEGKGYSFVYSHRFYGKKAREEMNDWLKTKGEETESALLEWNPPKEAIPAD